LFTWAIRFGALEKLAREKQSSRIQRIKDTMQMQSNLNSKPEVERIPSSVDSDRISQYIPE